MVRYRNISSIIKARTTQEYACEGYLGNQTVFLFNTNSITLTYKKTTSARSSMIVGAL